MLSYIIVYVYMYVYIYIYIHIEGCDGIHMGICGRCSGSMGDCNEHMAILGF